MAALAVKSLLKELNLQYQNNMFNLVNSWITGEKVSRKTVCLKNTVLVLVLTVCVFVLVQMAMRRLGAQVCGLFVEVQGAKFSRRLDVLIPLIEKEIHTSNFEDVSAEFYSMNFFYMI